MNFEKRCPWVMKPLTIFPCIKESLLFMDKRQRQEEKTKLNKKTNINKKLKKHKKKKQ